MEPPGAVPPSLRANLERVRAAIARAADRAHRDPASVRLVAVTKSVGPEAARALADLGVGDLAESRVQAGLLKQAALALLRVTWHLVGPLQRNKARQVPGAFAWFHALESLPQAEELSRRACAAGHPVRCLLQVNVAGEAGKHGVEPTAAAALLASARALGGITVEGLMTMPPESADPSASRPHFRALRDLRDALGGGASLPHLSMGMSGDFEVAVEEGATMVRVGRALFDGAPIS